MPYKVELNRHSNTARLVYYAVISRKNIGGRGERNRRIVKRDGRDYHVTKGWRA